MGASSARVTAGPTLLAPRSPRESGREDSNLRPPAPKAGALPDCATPRTPRALKRTSKRRQQLNRLSCSLIEPPHRKDSLPLLRSARIDDELERVSVRA